MSGREFFFSDQRPASSRQQADAEGRYIRLRGVRTHTLKNIDLDLPREQLIVLTGVSGSGKSSLAFDTLYAEGQRRYVESLSTDARQFLSIMAKPDLDQITGLAPAIAIAQHSGSHNPRSTVGTITEIYDYLRLLFARVGQPHCPTHGTPLAAQTISQMVDQVLALPEGEKLMLLAPLVIADTENPQRVLAELHAQGFIRARIDGQVHELSAAPALNPAAPHQLAVVIDRLRVRADVARRLAESFETALKLSGGRAQIGWIDAPERPELSFSALFACPHCGYSVPELEPRLFSFNNPAGACPSCHGLGSIAAAAGPSPSVCPQCQGTRLTASARHVFINGHSLPELVELPIGDLLTQLAALEQTGQRAAISAPILHDCIQRLRFLVDVGLDYLTLARPAATLSGGEAQRIRLASQIGAGLVGVMYILDEPSLGLHQRDTERLLHMLMRLRDQGNTVIVVEHDLDIIRAADWVVDLGPGAGALGGEIVAQGTAAQLAAHPRSLTGQYLAGVQRIERPAPRRSNAPNNPNHPTRALWLLGASGQNLRDLDVSIPIGTLCCITGVSGSGKSTLINDTLFPAVAQHFNGASITPAPYRALDGLEHLDSVIAIDQRPIGRTPRSNPATYTGLFDTVRELFAAVPEARARGYDAGRFSFNLPGGRCEACKGDGVIRVAMHFLPDVYVPCDVCGGRRYNRETLEIRYKGRTIDAVLTLTVAEALTLFAAVPVLVRKLQTLIDVGLSYLQLGQSATTLSGGEAQRLKLSRELAKRDSGRTLYLLDEPTTGLHIHDVKQLLAVLQRLRDQGNTIVVIEHHLDVIKTADWVIDLGPEGGERGGQVIAVGTPEAIAAHPTSHTGRYLRAVLAAT